MKLPLYLYLIFANAYVQTLSPMPWPTVDSTFIKKHTVSNELAIKLDQHSHELARLVDHIHATPRQKHGVWQFDWLPGYYVKYNVSRIVKRELLAACIEKEGLHLLHTPKKFLFHLRGRPTTFDNLNYVVVCEKVYDDAHAYQELMDLEQVQQFAKAIEKTGHISTLGGNFLRLSNRKISLIDTDGTFDVSKPNTGLIRLLNRDLSHYYTPEARAYLIDKIAEHLAKEENTYKKKRCEEELDQVVKNQSQSIAQSVRKALKKRIKYHSKPTTPIEHTHAIRYPTIAGHVHRLYNRYVYHS